MKSGVAEVLRTSRMPPVNSATTNNEIVIGTVGIKAFNGTSVSAAGLSANSTVYANVGAVAGNGTVTGVFTWTFSDNAQDGVVGPASTGN